MTSTDIFGTHDASQTVDPEKAASALGDILGFFHGEAMGGNEGISQGIGNQTVGTTTTTTQTASAPTSQGNGSDHASPVPQGTGISQGYGGDDGGHPGIDFAVPLDTQLLAAASGTVTHASNDDPGGYGEWVEITTGDGIAIRYGHLHGTSVQVGDQVHAGQVIGTSGGEAGGATSGNSTGAHLHFEVRANGHPIDPTPFLAGGYQIIGGTGPADSTSTTTSPNPQELAAVQLQNVVSGLHDGAMQSTDQKATTTTQQGQAGQAGQAADTGNFASDVLAGIGAPATPENVRAIQAWMRAEGGASHNNPLNTTQGAEGASDFNSVGVKTYTSYQQGLQATIQTLLNGYYGNIIAALKQGNNAMAVADAIEQSPWGTGGLVKQILQGG